MKNLTPRTIAEHTGGVYYGPEAIADTEISAVTTDSRQCTPGCLFAAIKGERADGHSFIEKAAAGGAMLILAEEESAKEKAPCVIVPSTTDALKKLAHAYLAEIGPLVISVTGSVGKTSTKETIAAVLSQKYKTKKTPGNFNNALGLPLSIFTLEEGDECAVLEMGINHFGEMDELATIAPPDISVITNIGACHLEFLGDRDGVFRAKTEVFDHLKENGTVILNGDDDKLRAVTEVKGRKPVFFGIDDMADVYADNIEYLGMEAVYCMIHAGEESFTVRIPYPGRHMVMNALAAASCGLRAGLLPAEIKAGIESLVLPDGRFHLIDGERCVIIDDCYNANPMSMKASLKVLSEAKGRRVAILGDMAELGIEEARYHREVGEYAASLPLDLVITCGDRCEEMDRGIREAAPQMPLVHFHDNEALIAALPALIQNEDIVLVKASHSMHFEEITKALS